MSDMKSISDAIISGDIANIRNLTEDMIGKGYPADQILQEGLIKGMDVVGEKMQTEEMFIPEVLLSAKCMGESVEVLKPLLGEDSVGAAGIVVIGTVKGDLHDIGKNLVAMMLESAGFKVTDLGVDVAPEVFLKAAVDYDADIVALSALLTTTKPMLRETISTLRGGESTKKIKIMVGGAPVTGEYAREIGADGFALDAGGATQSAKELVGM